MHLPCIGQVPTCADVWLLQPPHPTVEARVWEVVCMVALAAIDNGQQCMWGMHKEWLDGRDKEQTVITAYFPNQRGQISTLTEGDRIVPRASARQWHASGA